MKRSKVFYTRRGIGRNMLSGNTIEKVIATFMPEESCGKIKTKEAPMTMEDGLRQEIEDLNTDIDRLRHRLKRKDDECREYWSRLQETEMLRKEKHRRESESKSIEKTEPPCP